MLDAKFHLNPVQIHILTPFEIVESVVRGSEPRMQSFICDRPSKHPLDADLALYESLSALVWEKTSVLAEEFYCPGVHLGNLLSLGRGITLAWFLFHSMKDCGQTSAPILNNTAEAHTEVVLSIGLEVVPSIYWSWGEEAETLYHTAKGNPTHENEHRLLLQRRGLSRKWCDRRRLLKSSN